MDIRHARPRQSVHRAPLTLRFLAAVKPTMAEYVFIVDDRVVARRHILSRRRALAWAERNAGTRNPVWDLMKVSGSRFSPVANETYRRPERVTTAPRVLRHQLTLRHLGLYLSGH